VLVHPPVCGIVFPPEHQILATDPPGLLRPASRFNAWPWSPVAVSGPVRDWCTWKTCDMRFLEVARAACAYLHRRRCWRPSTHLERAKQI